MKTIFTKEFLAEFRPLSIYIIEYGDISTAKASKGKVKSVPKSSKTMGKEEKGSTRAKRSQKPLKTHYTSKKRHYKKETGKTTFNKKPHHKSRQKKG